jgi:predicted Zn-dependent peptidase
MTGTQDDSTRPVPSKRSFQEGAAMQPDRRRPWSYPHRTRFGLGSGRQGSARLSPMMQSVNMTSHKGISSYWLDREGLCTGTLIFGVGMRNEPPTLAGITHLVEHLLLRMVQPVTVPHGGTVNTDSLQFYASGRPDDVAGFLNAIAAAAAKLEAVTEENLTLEKSVLEAEDPHKFSTVSGGLLTYRYGTNGVGAAHFGAPGTAGLTKAEISEWASRWLTSGNAALTFTGPLPASLDLRLPPAVPVKRHQDPPLITTPTLIMSRKQGIALSLLVPSRDARLLGGALQYELLLRLRHSRGLIYSVESLTTPIDTHQSQLDLILDPLPANTVSALREALGALRGIAEAGFSEDAVQSTRHALVSELGWDDFVPQDYLDQLAIDALLNRSTPDRQELLDRAAAMSSAELTKILKSSMASLIVALDKSVKLSKTVAEKLGLTIDRYEIWQRHHNLENHHRTEERDAEYPAWRHKSSHDTLTLTPTRLIWRDSGKTKAISLADVAVVGNRSCGCISLMDRRGRSSELSMDDWKANKKLRRKLLGAFPPEIIRSFPED